MAKKRELMLQNMMTNNFRNYFSNGLSFLRENPQLWYTAFVGLVIVGAFMYMMQSFASIAQDTQEQYINDRVGWIYDSLVIFVPDILESPDVLRERLKTIKDRNETIESFTILAPHGGDMWRIYVADSGLREGTLISGNKELLDQARIRPNEAYTMEYQKNGERYYTTARAILNNAGTLAGIIVSEQRLSEADRLVAERIRTSQYVLAGILLLIMILFFRHARIVDYAVLYKKQLEVDEMKDSFVSMASHELKSPLTVIRGYIEFLKEGCCDEDQRKEYLRRIDVSTDELRELIDGILDVSRIEMGRMSFSPSFVEPHELLEDVVGMFKDSSEKKGVTLTLADCDEAGIQVDRARLKQVLINLVSNAVKYTLKGSIVVKQKVTSDSVEISVRDSGVGMTAEEQKKLFGKFYRVQAEETKGVSGTGLGLWITKYIIEHMDGSISVESIKGEGSRFVVVFPRATKGDSETEEQTSQT